MDPQTIIDEEPLLGGWQVIGGPPKIGIVVDDLDPGFSDRRPSAGSPPPWIWRLDVKLTRAERQG